MTESEFVAWCEANRSMTKDTRAYIPCDDCMVEFAISQGMRGNCIQFHFEARKENGETLLEPGIRRG